MAVDIEMLQELLDAGYSPTKAASKCGLHHSTILRLIKRGELEVYEAFDENVKNFKFDDLDWLSEEDELEKICEEAFDNGYVIDRSLESVQELGLYVRDKYGNIINYITIKGFNHLLSEIKVKCNRCDNSETLEDALIDETRSWGLMSKCRKCHNSFTKKWVTNNKDTYRNFVSTRLEKYSSLPYRLKEQEVRATFSYFNSKCAITGREDKNLTLEHFIPLDIGHSGTHVGNLIPLLKRVNSSKNSTNPFEWFENWRFKDFYDDNWEKLIQYLANQNALTVEEYKEFVNWCFKNPRTLEEIAKDPRHSIEIWREATNKHFPLPEYVINVNTRKEATA
jgi:5-methylcytosine-specific restriction endonuclease McrA